MHLFSFRPFPLNGGRVCLCICVLSHKICVSICVHLQGVRAKALHLRLYNTSLSHIPENLFQELGRVQNISIDVSGNNKALKKQLNPNTAQHPLESERVYLTDLKISGNSFTCDCEIG